MAIAAALLHQLEAVGVDRQRIGLLIDDDFALQGTVELGGHGVSLYYLIRTGIEGATGYHSPPG